MTNTEFQLRGIHDARLAVHAASASPAWLWTPDGARVLWANAVGIALLGAADGAALAGRAFAPDDPQRRQIARLADRLSPAAPPRLERLRGFGAPLGGFLTCICTRLPFTEGDSGILIVAAAPVGRAMPLAQRLRRLVETVAMPMAAFTPDGGLAGASTTAQPLLDAQALADADLARARDRALEAGHAETTVKIGHVALQRIGSGGDIGVIATITPPPSEQPVHAPLTEPAAENDAIADDAVAATAPEASAAAPLPDDIQPIRFVWQMDADGRFLLGSDDFIRAIGPRTAGEFGRPWREIVAALDLDPQGLVETAVATRDTWSGVTLNWPVDDPGRRLPVELSGLPMFDRARRFIGYRGFGVCRDLARLHELTGDRRATLFHDLPAPPPVAADIDAAPASEPAAPPPEAPPSAPADPDTILDNASDNIVETSRIVVPFRPASDAKSPVLTPVENNAFHELARQLSARLESEATEADIAADDAAVAAPEATHEVSLVGAPQPPVAPRDASHLDPRLLDLMPCGVLIFRLERLLHVNRALLGRLGFDTRAALDAAGGLDALSVDPPEAVAGSLDHDGAAVTVTTQNPGVPPAQARLAAIAWDGEPALALILTGAATAARAEPAPTIAASAPPPPESGQVNAEELGAILDTMAEGVVMFDRDGRISVCNRGAEALFGLTGDDFTRRSLADLFAPESESAVRDTFDSIANADAASVLDQGREVLGRVRDGGLLPLAMTIGRTVPGSPNFFAVFRDLTQSRKEATAQAAALRQSERAATAKADVLARVSHEIRTPLNAIIGFADVMIDERFGPLGHERYAEYLKDIRASGERVAAIVEEMLDLSRAETGKLDLAFGRHSLNDLLEQCVAVMQPRANRERIIIRTSLAHTLPSVVADARTLRQIALNLIGNSIRLANAGGQVIVSTALSDEGCVVLRVRDTGHGMNDNELAAAVEPFGAPMPDQTPGHVGVSLALTKALVEANRARFQIKSVPRSGTLIEVTFPQAAANVKA